MTTIGREFHGALQRPGPGFEPGDHVPPGLHSPPRSALTPRSPRSRDPVAAGQRPAANSAITSNTRSEKPPTFRMSSRVRPPASCAYGWMSMQTSFARRVAGLERRPLAHRRRAAAAAAVHRPTTRCPRRRPPGRPSRLRAFSYASGAEQLVPPPAIAASFAALVITLSRGLSAHVDDVVLERQRPRPSRFVPQHRRRHQRRHVDAPHRRRRALADAGDRRVHRARDVRADVHLAVDRRHVARSRSPSRPAAPRAPSPARPASACVYATISWYGKHPGLGDRVRVAQPRRRSSPSSPASSNTPWRANVFRFMRVICHGAFSAIAFQCFGRQRRRLGQHLERHVRHGVRRRVAP